MRWRRLSCRGASHDVVAAVARSVLGHHPRHGLRLTPVGDRHGFRPIQRAPRLRHGPVLQRHHVRHPGTGRCGPGLGHDARADGRRVWHRVCLPGVVDWLSAGSPPTVAELLRLAVILDLSALVLACGASTAVVASSRLEAIRMTYEPYLQALSTYLLMELPTGYRRPMPWTTGKLPHGTSRRLSSCWGRGARSAGRETGRWRPSCRF